MRGLGSAFPVIAVALALGQDSSAAPASAVQPKLQLNGWYPCGLSIAPSPNSTASKYASLSPFQCAEVEMPLCHEGICESDKTINVFVRRLLADSKQKQPTANKALWILQGGPGASSANMERIMLTMANHTSEKVDFYTMDHRGTGRSNFLECQAAQAFAQGSPSGVQIAYFEYSNCIKDLLFQMDNHTEAYSVTSAAKDIEVLVDRLHGPNVDVFVYGMSYGTYFTERIMHLAPKKVKGYILDGVIAEDNPTFSNWNTINLPTDARFVKLCEDDKFCNSKLSAEIEKYGNLTAAWRAIYKQLDDLKPNSKNKCKPFIESVYGNDTKPSDIVKQYLDELSGDVAKRLLIPAIMHRLYKCDDGDVEFLSTMLDPRNEIRVSSSSSVKALASALSARSAQPVAFDQVKGQSPFLSALIKASEMWTFPSVTWSQERDNFDNGLFSSDISSDFIDNCILTAEKSNPACSVFSEMAPGVDISKLLNHPPFVYKRDKYWGKFATIPEQASVLMVNGKLDFMTPSEWGAHEFENLKGDNKLMINLDNGVHCAASRPTTFDDETECGYQIIASYVVSGGAIEKVDSKCIRSLPPLNFADLNAIQSVLPQVNSTDELYDSKTTLPTKSDSKSNRFSIKVHKHHHGH